MSYSCYEHGWSSPHFSCPKCHDATITSSTIYLGDTPYGCKKCESLRAENERLKTELTHKRVVKCPDCGEVMMAGEHARALDEIARLREALENLLNSMSKPHNLGKSWSEYQIDDDAVKQARAALELSKGDK